MPFLQIEPIFDRVYVILSQVDKSTLYHRFLQEFFSEKNAGGIHFVAREPNLHKSFIHVVGSLEALVVSIQSEQEPKERAVEIWTFFHNLLQSSLFIELVLQQDLISSLQCLTYLLAEVAAHICKAEDIPDDDLIIKSQIKAQLLGLFNNTKWSEASREKFYLEALVGLKTLADSNSIHLNLLLELLTMELPNLTVNVNATPHGANFILRFLDTVQNLCSRNNNDDHFPICARIVACLCKKGFRLCHQTNDLIVPEQVGPTTLFRRMVTYDGRGLTIYRALAIGFYQLVPVLLEGGISVDARTLPDYSEDTPLAYFTRLSQTHTFSAKYSNFELNLWRCVQALIFAGADVQHGLFGIIDRFVWQKKLDLREEEVVALLQGAVNIEDAMQKVEATMKWCPHQQRGWTPETLAFMQRIFSAVRRESFTVEIETRTVGETCYMPLYTRWPTPLRMCVLSVLALAGRHPDSQQAYHPVCYMRGLPPEIEFMVFEILKYAYDLGRHQKTDFAFLPAPRALPPGGAAGADDCLETCRETSLETVLKTEPRP